MTVCIHCALIAFVNGQVPQMFDESPAEHMIRVHPHGVDPAERRELERRAEARVRELELKRKG